jgi:hypothetical protein
MIARSARIRPDWLRNFLAPPPPSVPFPYYWALLGALAASGCSPRAFLAGLLHPLRPNAPTTAVLALFGRIWGRLAPKSPMWPAPGRSGPQSSPQPAAGAGACGWRWFRWSLEPLEVEKQAGEVVTGEA